MVVRELNGKTIVFDVDGVIAKNNNGSYADAEPFFYAIEQVNLAYDKGYYVKLCTARYGDRCKGNISQIYQRGYREIQDWMTKYGVKYDELIMGKPSGDIYVDDKGCRVDSKNGEHEWKYFWARLDGLKYVDKYNQIRELDVESAKLESISNAVM